MITFNLSVSGFWLKDGIDNMPKNHGIYFVYRARLISENEIDLIELIYIGKADQEGGIRARLSAHEKMPDFEMQARRGEVIVFSYASLNSYSLERVENALIYTQQPILNDKGTKSFNYQDTEVRLFDDYALIKEGVWNFFDKSIIINLN